MAARSALLALALAGTLAGTAAAARPIVGILSQETEAGADGGSYIAASYVKWLESAGARVVPVHYESSAAELAALFGSINGFLIPGGAASLRNTSQFYAAAKTMFGLALAANEKGDYFPVWGTCLGFETLMRLGSGSDDSILVSGLDSEDYPVPLTATPAFAGSRLFKELPASLSAALTSQNITMNNHHSGTTPAGYAKSAALSAFFTVLSTNVDRQGKAFLSTVQGKQHPVYGSQWHPEKNCFEWTVKEAIPHSVEAVAACQWTANFFVGESRKSNHSFPTVELETAALIYNDAATFTGKAGSGFEQEYIFK